MHTLTPQISEFHTLREELDLRPNHRLVEAEVNDLLQQTLPQLDWLHSQGKSHEAISLDTLAFYEGQIRLLESDVEPQEFPDPSRDIAALGQVVLQALTGQPVKNLRDANGNWNWEDECLVTDHLTDIVNQMIGNTGEPSLGSGQQILEMLNNQQQTLNPVISPIQSTMEISSESPGFYVQPTTNFANSYSVKSIVDEGHQQNPKKLKFKLKTWQWATLGTLCGVGLLSALALPSFMGQASRAKQAMALIYLGSIASAQGDNFKDYNFFIDSWDELGIGINRDQSSGYMLNMYKSSNVQVIATATAQNRSLKSYSAIVFLTQVSDGRTIPNFTICRTIEPSRVPPQPIQLLETSVVCPQGSEIHSNTYTGGRNLLGPSSQSSSSTSQNTSPNSTSSNQNSSRMYTFRDSDYPQSACGDSMPRNSDAYPVSFYPVFITRSDSNLRRVRAEFCGDALPVYREAKGETYIQVGSFTSYEKAQAFADFMYRYFNSGEVGEPRVIDSLP